MADNKGTGWMYNPDGEMNKEEYLLGKKIGQNFESKGTMGQLNAVEYDCAPPSIFASTAQHQVDMQRKLMEDPLVVIKKREMEERKRILDNPLKVRALQEHIASLKKAKKDKKKKKKKKKRKGSDSDESDTDLDLKLLQRLQRIEGRETAVTEEEKPEAESPSAKYLRDASPSPDTPPRPRKQFNPKGRESGGRPPLQLDSGTTPARKERYRRRSGTPSSHDRIQERNRSPGRRRSQSRSPARPWPRSPGRRRSRSQSPARRRSRSPARRRRSRSRSPAKRQSRSRSPPRRRPSKSPPRRSGNQENRKNKSREEMVKVKEEAVEDQEDEKARRLREMMENAAWRDDQRTKKVQAYRNREREEEEERRREHDPEFLSRQLKTAAASSSLETRIRSNKYNIQRDHGVMDKNFARR